MHIPDSMLSPSTSAAMGVAMAPIWIGSAAKMRHGLKTREVPLLALGAAFCFTVMMFNIPALGGTTAHPVAGTLLAILLGPWAAVIGISVALAIQALFFGDGGLLTYGANAFTMAFALPFVGYGVYVLLSRRLKGAAGGRPLCAAVGAYFGINAAAALVGVLLGIQPALFHEANGHALYFPFGMSVTLPAMLGTHLLIAGPAESIVTMLAVAYLQSARIPLYGVQYRSDLEQSSVKSQSVPTTPRMERIWIALAVCLALTPLGLIAKGDAWGEWDAQAVARKIQQVGGSAYVPKGIESQEQHAYKGVKGLSDYGSERGGASYLAAGLLGAGAITLVLFFVGGFIARSQGDEVVPSNLPSANRLHPSGKDSHEALLPAWLTAASTPSIPIAPQAAGNRYLIRSVADMARRGSQALNAERLASQSGLLQELDARAKICSMAMVLGAVTVSHHILPLAGIYLAAVVLAHLSRIPLAPFIRRVWLAVPVFVGGLILPVVLNTVTPGSEACVLLQHPHIAITKPGLMLACVLIVRVGVAVSLGALLAITTRWSDLLSGLRALGAPRVFVTTLAMAYRYIALMLNSATEMFQARTSRTVGQARNSEGRRFVGAGIGSLFGKTLVLSEEVHSAMISRGFTGDLRTLRKPVWRSADTALLCGAIAVAVLAVVFEWKLGAM